MNEKCRRKKSRKYGGHLIFCGGYVFQEYDGQIYSIRYRPRPPIAPYGVDETTVAATTTEEVTTEQQQEINYEEDSTEIIIGRNRQLINAPKKCAAGYDANGGCVADNEVFS
ncbi:hypothetical protein QE152_g15306 [Popillia japonica]|uniref:Uncharacterized protein n=1 Tax=Popillia japonica TaxID=7064 RepID=A0AAW1L661_POPJA